MTENGEVEKASPCPECARDECFSESPEAQALIEEALSWSEAVCEARQPGRNFSSVRRFHCYKGAARVLGYRDRQPLPKCFTLKVQEVIGESVVGFKRASDITSDDVADNTAEREPKKARCDQ